MCSLLPAFQLHRFPLSWGICSFSFWMECRPSPRNRVWSLSNWFKPLLVKENKLRSNEFTFEYKIKFHTSGQGQHILLFIWACLYKIFFVYSYFMGKNIFYWEKFLPLSFSFAEYMLGSGLTHCFLTLTKFDGKSC